MADINYELLHDFHTTLSTRFFNVLAAVNPPEWQLIADEMASSSERNDYPFLGETSGMRKWLGERIADQLESHRYSIVNEKFEKTMEAKLDQLADDAGGLLATLTNRTTIMARAIARHPDELIIGGAADSNIPGALLAGTSTACYDGQNFFDTDHPVGSTTASNDLTTGGTDAWYLLDTTKDIKPLIYQRRVAPTFDYMNAPTSDYVFRTHKIQWGAWCRDAAGYGLWQSAMKMDGPITETTFVKARERMQAFRNDVGQNFGMNPNILVVPRGKRMSEALKLFSLPLINGGESNWLFQGIRVVVSNYLPFNEFTA